MAKERNRAFFSRSKEMIPIKIQRKKEFEKKTKLDNTISTGQDSVIGVSKIQEPEYLKR